MMLALLFIKADLADFQRDPNDPLVETYDTCSIHLMQLFVQI